MRVFVSVDMEGATGVCHRDQLLAGGAEYERARRWLTGDVNAAVEGALEAGAEEILVADGHGSMRNIVLEDLHEAAELLVGPAQPRNRPLCQLAALSQGAFDAALFVGYHARAGTPGGLLAHTWVGSRVHEIRLNGAPAGETRLNAAILGCFGVPVVFAAGSDDLCREARADLGDDLEVTQVKQTVGPSAVRTLAPKRAQRLIREGVARALRRGKRVPYVAASPVEVEVEFHRREMAEQAVEAGGERTGECVVRYRGRDMIEAAEQAWAGLANSLREEPAWLA